MCACTLCHIHLETCFIVWRKGTVKVALMPNALFFEDKFCMISIILMICDLMYLVPKFGPNYLQQNIVDMYTKNTLLQGNGAKFWNRLIEKLWILIVMLFWMSCTCHFGCTFNFKMWYLNVSRSLAAFNSFWVLLLLKMLDNSCRICF